MWILLSLILILVVIIHFELWFDMNRETGEWLLWYTFNKKRHYFKLF